MIERMEANQAVFQPMMPDTLSFRDETLNADTECRLHNHSFGQLIYVVSGVMETQVGGQRFLAPPELMRWSSPPCEPYSL